MENARVSAAPWIGAEAGPVTRQSRVAATARVKRFIRNDIALWPPGVPGFCSEDCIEVRAHFGVFRVDLQRPPEFDDFVVKLPLAGQREAQSVVRDGIIWPQ